MIHKLTSRAPDVSQSIDWYAKGQSRTVDIGGIQITVQFVGRKGGRGRIAIAAPPGAMFRAVDRDFPGSAD